MPLQRVLELIVTIRLRLLPVVFVLSVLLLVVLWLLIKPEPARVGHVTRDWQRHRMPRGVQRKVMLRSILGLLRLVLHVRTGRAAQLRGRCCPGKGCSEELLVSGDGRHGRHGPRRSRAFGIAQRTGMLLSRCPWRRQTWSVVVGRPIVVGAG
jgi:hypothetical protein